MRTTWTFHNASQLLFGRGAAGQLGDCVRQLGGRRVLIVTDRALVDASVVEQVQAPLVEANIEVSIYDGGKPEPPVALVDEVVTAANAFQPDLLLGLGGGSNMDVAKAAAAVLAHGGKATDYAGDQVVPGPVFPLILVPTTSGTGSEVTAAAVLADPDRGTKFGILSNYLRPSVAVVDPQLTVSCPPRVTAGSGIDALTHAVEAYTAIDNDNFPLLAGERTVYQGRHPLADVLAQQAIELVGQHLRGAVSDGNDIDAREGMSLAAMLAGMAFSNTGVAAVHALEYALNKVAHTPHGVGCGLLLPYVMRFNAPARPKQMRRIAELLGQDVSMLDDQSAAHSAVTAVENIKQNIGIPARLGDVDVHVEHLPAMAEMAYSVKRILRVNPRELTLQDMQAILESAF